MRIKNEQLLTLHWIGAVTGKKKFYSVVLTLLQIVLGVSSVLYAVILRGVIDAAVGGNRSGFFLYTLSFAGLILFQLVLRAGYRFLEEYSRAVMENCFKSRLLAFLLRADYSRVTGVHSGEWMNRLTSDTVVVADGLAQILPGVVGMFVKLVGALVMILYLEGRFAYILIPGGILLVVLTACFRKRLKKLHKKTQEADGALRVFLQERLGSLLVIRAFVKEEQTEGAAAELMAVHKKARMNKNHFSNVCNFGFGGVMQGAYAVGVLVCGYGLLTGTMSYGTLMAILQLISQVKSPFANITGYVPKYYAMLASAERLAAVESFEGEGLVDSLAAATPSADLRAFYTSDFLGLSLEDACFSYRVSGDLLSAEPEPDAEGVVVLRHVKLRIKKGEYIAFTGPSGCGKSTVLKLLMWLYPLDGGSRFVEVVGGRLPLEAAHRRLFAYVPQGNHLMSGTLREIVTFSDPRGMVDEVRIWRALTIACAKDFVKDLAGGLDTPLGERGLGLSEGQMQRIAIARAIFSDNPILMLDESTSALDEATEKQLLRNLRAMTDKTVLIVTHRPAVLAICDKKVVFSETGCHVRYRERTLTDDRIKDEPIEIGNG